ncbi:hypothetical protein JIG36_22635 [Actinoplanes sp. LDG1-06]|uniref:Uncharacterized protein n=1 Tax=Paractinoplanes ovalisporus TaxID=2810368 RepID=A0ABS2AEW1_9ACTN|nr:hypothetical protein [Actinoplanes ovalisporus]MBM2618362.1 hypothetical protein [Actinoplanes ovalisporus]
MSRPITLQITTIIVGVVAIVAGAAVAVLVPEIRCHIGLSPCPEPVPTTTTRTFVDVAPADDEPFLVPGPEVPATGEPIRIWLDDPAIVNPGKPVPVMLRGSGFQPEGLADIDWRTPDGGTYLGTATYVGADGKFATGLYWWPLQDMGVAGSNGAWSVQVTDRTSRRTKKTSLRVTSGPETPGPDQWPSRMTWLPPLTGTPAVAVDIRGDVCRDDGARVELTASGFPPDANINIHQLRADGQRIGFQNWQTDGYGRTEHVVEYFRSNGCNQATTFPYRVVVNVDGWYAEVAVPLRATPPA